MYSPAFERQKWEKRHDYLVEQFDPVNIRDVLGFIPAHHANNRLPWSPPGHPHLAVVPRKCGCMVRWFFLCPACGRRCEDLYPAYLGDTKDLKCRICSDLIYSSQRYGSRHPLRKTLTPRKRVGEQRRLARLEKKAAKNQRNVDIILQDIRSKEFVDYDFPAIQQAMETAIGGVRNMEFVNEPNSLVQLPGFSQAENEKLFQEVKATMMDLAQNAKSAKVRKQAQKGLRERGWGYEEPKPEVTLEVGQKPDTLADNPALLNSIHIPEEQIEHLKKMVLEAGEDLSGL